VSEQHERLDVVAVGAHPDDVEIGCGGTLARLVDQGYRVGIIDLTDGEPTPLSPGPEARRQEAAEAAAILGIHRREILALPNRRLMDGFEPRVELAKWLRRWRPQLVIGLGSKTPLASPDHYQAVQITDAAVFYSRLTKWDDCFDGLPVHAVARQLYYHLGFDPAGSWGEAGRLTVDISDTLDRKLASVRCYRTQFPPEKQYVLDRVAAIAQAVGGACGFGAGEVLTSPRPLGVSHLMDALQLLPAGPDS
jgi:LmbE family N-acetylglucosaminyl deacetylase